MLGVKRGSELETKFGSVHLKKSDLEKEDLELSGSLLKFSKRNEDASVSNKDLGGNKSGQWWETCKNRVSQF
jgi:hypothetical protein